MPYLKIVHNEETLEVMDIRYFDCGDGFTYVKLIQRYISNVHSRKHTNYSSIKLQKKKETKKLHVMFKILK